MMGGPHAVVALAKLRKRVQKASADELSNGSILKEALDTICSKCSDEAALEVLSLLLVLARKLRTVLSECPPQTHDLVHCKLDPCLLPSEPIAVMLLNGLDSTEKPRRARAADCLAALARMTEVLLPPLTGTSAYDGILTPLFEHACRSELARKRDLEVINTLLPFVPSAAVPQDLLSRLQSQMATTDAASLRGSILCKLLVDLYTATIGDDITKISAMLQRMMPMFAGSDTAVLTNSTRYLLPSLFKAVPQLSRSLLEQLQPVSSSQKDFPDTATKGRLVKGDLPAWIAIASLCISTNQLSLSALSTKTLQLATEHAEVTVQIDTVRLLISSRELLRPSTLDLIKRSIQLCSTLPDAYGRSEFTATMVTLLKSLKTTKTLARSTQAEVSAVDTFLAWLLEHFIDAGLSVALRYPVVRAVLALNVLSTYVDEFHDDVQIHTQIFNRSRVDSLLACQSCNFAEIRSKSRTILAASKIPLPGYESLDTPTASTLLASAKTSISHPRKTQAEAGKAVLCVLFETLAKQPHSDQACRMFISELVDDLEIRIRVAEDDLVKGITSSPLHGLISAISGVVNCIRIHDASQQLWKLLFRRLISLVGRVWAATSKVVSLATDGNNERPDHEIARAYEVMAGEMDGEGDLMDPTNLLSCCWRATTEAAELLAAITSVPLVQLGDAQGVWTVSDIDAAGKRFLTWLHEIRHRGTFSKVASSFGKTVAAVRAIESLRHLCRSWLDLELNEITTKTFSTTRRSAALPYSLLALVVVDRELLNITVNRLVDVARVNNERSDDVTRVHAFNILRIILFDTRTARHLDRSFERVIIMALEAFSSANWNVRNVGLILFSSLIHRSLGWSDGTQNSFQSRQHLSKRQTLNSWASKYPSIIPFVRKELRAAAPNTEHNVSGSLFPILIILRSLRWSPNVGELSQAIQPEVEPFLGSREWQVRRIAAQALASLVSPETAVGILAECSRGYLELGSNNARQGYLLFWTRLVTDVVPFPDCNENDKARIARGIIRLLDRVGHQTTPAPIIEALLDLSSSIQLQVNSQRLDDRILALAKACLEAVPNKPGADVLVDTASRILVQSDDGLQFLLRQDSAPIPKQIAVEHLASQDSTACMDPSMLSSVASILDSEMTQPTLVIAALEALTTWTRNEDAASSISGPFAESLSTRIRLIVKNSKNVPLRETALPTLGRTVNLLLSELPAQALVEIVEDLVQAIDEASKEDQSKPSRSSAVRAIEHVRKWLYPIGGTTSPIDPESLLAFHRLVLRLLQDDDHDVRETVRDLVCRGLALEIPTCLDRVIDLEWQWIGRGIRDGSVETGGALQLLWDRCLDIRGFEQNIAALRPAGHQRDILFEVEPPNQFRDPLIDSYGAAQQLASVDSDWQDEKFSRQWRDNIAQLNLLIRRAESAISDDQPKAVTPIDEAWEARRSLHRRKRIYSALADNRPSL